MLFAKGHVSCTKRPDRDTLPAGGGRREGFWHPIGCQKPDPTHHVLAQPPPSRPGTQTPIDHGEAFADRMPLQPEPAPPGRKAPSKTPTPWSAAGTRKGPTSAAFHITPSASSRKSSTPSPGASWTTVPPPKPTPPPHDRIHPITFCPVFCRNCPFFCSRGRYRMPGPPQRPPSRLGEDAPLAIAPRRRGAEKR